MKESQQKVSNVKTNSDKHAEMLQKLVDHWSIAYPSHQEFVIDHQELIDEAKQVLSYE